MHHTDEMLSGRLVSPLHSGAIWNRNIEAYNGTGDYHCRNTRCTNLPTSTSKENDKPKSKKSSFMISDILSEENENRSSYPGTNLNEDGDRSSHSPNSDRSCSPDTSK